MVLLRLLRAAAAAALVLGAARGAAGPPPPLPASGTPAPASREQVLPNGLRVVVVEHRRRPVVLVRLLLPRGSLTDPPESGGATWLAVHLVSDFHEKGDDGEELVEEKSFRRQVAELGGSTVVEVGPDASLIGITGYAQDTKEYVRLLGDAVVRPRRGEEAFDSRRDALLDQLEDLETSDPEALGRFLAEAAFGQGHPYARSVVGTRASLTRLGLEDVVAQQERILAPGGATLLVVGDVGADAVFAAAKAAFAKWRRPSTASPAVRAAVAPAGRTDTDFLERKPAATLVACAARPLGDVQASDGALDVLAAVLGGGMRSRLELALRERTGLTYDASAGILRRRSARAFLACAALAAGDAGKGVRLFRETLDGVASTPPTDEEIRRAKGLLVGGIESSWDDSGRIAATWLEALRMGRARPRLDEDRGGIERVSPDELRALARTVLRPSALRWIVSGEARAAAQAVEGNELGRLRALALER